MTWCKRAVQKIKAVVDRTEQRANGTDGCRYRLPEKKKTSFLPAKRSIASVSGGFTFEVQEVDGEELTTFLNSSAAQSMCL